MSRQAYHRQKGSGAMRKAAQEAFALEVVHRVRAVAPMIGGKKLWRIYLGEITGGDRMGRDRFEGMLSRHGLTIHRRVRRPRTTDSRHGLRTYPNLVYSLIPERINQVWVSDITYVPLWTSETEYTFCYMSLVTDAYSHELIGWAVGETLKAEYPAQALRMAMARLEGLDTVTVSALIHHSDRGVQYASALYVGLLQGRNIRISMTEDGNPRDNALAERIN